MSFEKPLSLQHIKDILREIRRSLKQYVKEAYIFGSIVSGSAIPEESDIDLLVVPEKEKVGTVDYYDLLSKAMELSLERGLNLHIIIYDEKRHSRDFLDNIKKNGIRLI